MDEPKRAKSGPDGAVNTSAAQALANVLSADIPRSDAYAMATGYLWAKTRKEPLLASRGQSPHEGGFLARLRTKQQCLVATRAKQS